MPRSPAWKWYVCGLLLLATMLNYMDRQTLAQVSTDIKEDFEQRGLELTATDYGRLERGFGLAFAVGALVTGFIVDQVSVRWMYPLVLIGWSAAGFATAWASDFPSLLICRVILGFFEAGQWPCALTVSQRILSRQDRTLGNGLLQSGAALGAIFTPLIVQVLVTSAPGSWRGPFQVIGALGLLWVIPWFLLIRRDDLRVPQPTMVDPPSEPSRAVLPQAQPSELVVQPALSTFDFARRFLVLAVVVVMINLCWHFFRAWLPKFLREFHHYDRASVNYFTAAYYLATDIGSLAVGFATRRLIVQGWRVHSARVALFFLCAVLTGLSTVAAWLPAGWLLLGILLAIGFGALGLFPNYYSFSQELTTRHQGKVTGSLGFITWTCTAFMHPLVGERVDATQSYAEGIFLVGLAPLLALLALLFFWSWPRSHSPAAADFSMR